MWKRFFVGLTVLVAGLWVANSSRIAAWIEPVSGGVSLMAHRGVHQVYIGPPPGNETCTARPIAPPEHDLIENTLPSIRAAFDAGARAVEIDVHLTPDGTFAVFHDWTLDCRTDGTGVTHETPMAILRGLDAGHGYETADGQTPLRGKARGLIPTLTEVFHAFPEGKFLINFKSNRRSEGKALGNMLANSPAQRAAVFGVYGGERPTRAAIEAVPGLAGFDKASIKACLIRYLALGWIGYVPRACQTGLVAVPVDYAWALWGWPVRFERRMNAKGSKVILVGPSRGAGLVSGFDTPEQLDRVPSDFSGYIWTDRVEVIGPLLR